MVGLIKRVIVSGKAILGAAESLERLVVKAGNTTNIGLRKIRRPVLESWVFPVTVGSALGVEYISLAKDFNVEIIEQQDKLRAVFGELGYEFIEDIGPTLAAGAGIAFVAVPAAVALHRYYSRKKPTYGEKSGNFITKRYEETKKFLTENRLVNNRCVLPLLTALGMGHLALTSNLDLSSPIDIAKGILIAGSGLVAYRGIYDHFRGEVPVIPPRTRRATIIPLIHLLASASVMSSAGSILEREIIKPTAIADVEPLSETQGKIVGYRTVERRVMNYWDTSEYYARLYGEDTNFVRALIIAESNFKHYRRKKVLRSNRDAFGLGQQTKINVRHLNNLISNSRLVGEDFDWNEVVHNPAENIRATVATIKSLRESCENGQNARMCLEIIAASYVAGEPTIRSALERSDSDDLLDALPYLKSGTRSTVALYVSKVMAYYWALENNIVWPTDGKQIVSGYGARRDNGKTHRGIDIIPIRRGKSGEPIYTIGDGVVVSALDSGGTAGTHVKVRHGDEGSHLYSLYLHGVRRSINVRPGQNVRMGAKIMKMGATGNALGPHLHFETYLEYEVDDQKRRQYLDPLDLYRAYGRDEVIVDIRRPIYEDRTIAQAR